MAELQRHRTERPRPLPIQYRPLATAIVGERPVHLSTGTASRQALARVGKPAATTGDTIHVSSDRPTAEVIAHELTHVAYPSPVPRFFDDDVRGPEERQAEQVAAVMRRAPILPRTSSASGHAPTVAPAGRIQRSTGSTAPGTISAAALAASITRSTGPETISRVIGGHRGRSAATIPQPPPSMPTATIPSPPPSVQSDDAPAVQPTPDLLVQFNRILELLEERIVTELERRGGRFRGGF